MPAAKVLKGDTRAFFEVHFAGFEGYYAVTKLSKVLKESGQVKVALAKMDVAIAQAEYQDFNWMIIE